MTHQMSGSHGGHMQMGHNMPMGQEMQDCIQNCTDCHTSCLGTAAYCLQMGGKHAEPAHLGLMLDCAEMCQTSANFMLRGSEFHGYTCATCSTLCEQCAESCDQMGDDATMKACADMCRKCAASCRQMASMAGINMGMQARKAA